MDVDFELQKEFCNGFFAGIDALSNGDVIQMLQSVIWHSGLPNIDRPNRLSRSVPILNFRSNFEIGFR